MKASEIRTEQLRAGAAYVNLPADDRALGAYRDGKISRARTNRAAHGRETMPEKKINVDSGLAAFAWFSSWLFCVGFLKLQIPKALFALVLWPYFLGSHFAPNPEAPSMLEKFDE
ncbi:hypothetical protein [Parvularcula sp. LCG005]|uniref:hypothetical protein n=1 Tax=Parvularcula sp. LCG005 TaxID=3078805 RepID=UPI0029422261|nr:hypothetical protein [Parvularcula sp. LCG005]WOI54334.1 hypothetical protein RUI03_04870 [Parvularcula sp. LCG005]